jgi:F0F1-type ATP synthase assembly protein I
MNRNDFRVAVTTTVLLVAGLTLGIIMGSLLLGLWLDKLIGSKPILTILFVLAGIPVTLFLTYRVVKQSTTRLQDPNKASLPEEGSQRGKIR